MTLFGAVVLLGFYSNKRVGLNKQVDWNFSSNLINEEAKFGAAGLKNVLK